MHKYLRRSLACLKFKQDTFFSLVCHEATSAFNTRLPLYTGQSKNIFFQSAFDKCIQTQLDMPEWSVGYCVIYIVSLYMYTWGSKVVTILLYTAFTYPVRGCIHVAVRTKGHRFSMPFLLISPTILWNTRPHELTSLSMFMHRFLSNSWFCHLKTRMSGSLYATQRGGCLLKTPSRRPTRPLTRCLASGTSPGHG